MCSRGMILTSHLEPDGSAHLDKRSNQRHVRAFDLALSEPVWPSGKALGW